MPKKSAFPRLRTHVRKGAKGQVWTSWFYDRRQDGESDVPLGNDYDEALKKWDELHNRKPRISGTILEAMERWGADCLPGYANAETRKSYSRQLSNIKAVFGPATWDQVGMPALKGYLRRRTAKTQGNRELAVLSIVWNYARGEGLTKLPWPAAGMEKSRWKNKEAPRTIAITDVLFAAVYDSATSMLRDCMDLASATGLRLTDCRKVLMPQADGMPIRANKTGKAAEFVIAGSPVLERLVKTRKGLSLPHLMLLSSPKGKPVTERQLRDAWATAREKAAEAHPELADELRAMYLRDMRKRAADLAGSLQEASELLQHSSTAVTKRHYTSKDKLRPVR